MAGQQEFAATYQLPIRKAPLTSAEKQRNYRERLKQSPEKYERFKQKEAERHRERNKNRTKTEEEVALQRLKWRERVRKHRMKKKLEAEALKQQQWKQLQETFQNSTYNGSSLVSPDVSSCPPGVARTMNLDQIGQLENSSVDPADMNSGQYAMGAHDIGESVSSKVKLECNPDFGEDSFHAGSRQCSLEQRLTCTSLPSDDGLSDGHGLLHPEGSVPIGRTILSVVEEFSRESLNRKKPLTPAERQRNYMARLRAQPEKWEEYKIRTSKRRRKSNFQNDTPEDRTSRRTKRPYQRRRAVTEESNKMDGSVDTEQASYEGQFVFTEGLKVETGCDFDSQDTGDLIREHLLEFNRLNPYAADSDVNSTSEMPVENFFSAELSEDVRVEDNAGTSQSAVHCRGNEFILGSGQDEILTSPSNIGLVGGSPTRLTSAERQRNYIARLRAQPEKWQEHKVRDTKRRRMIHMQEKLSEEALAERRKQQAEKKKEYRRRKKNAESFPFARNDEAFNLNVVFDSLNSQDTCIDGLQTNVILNKDTNLSQGNQSDINGQASGSDTLQNAMVNVKRECVSPERDALYEVSNNEGNTNELLGNVGCRVDPKNVYENGGDTDIGDCQIPGRSRVSAVGRPGRGSREKARPSTPAERQRQYRERLKAQPEKWEQYKARESARRRSFRKKELSEAEAAEKRKQGRERKRASRRRKRELEESRRISQMKAVDACSEPHPGTSPSEKKIDQYDIGERNEINDAGRPNRTALGGKTLKLGMKLQDVDHTSVERGLDLIDKANLDVQTQESKVTCPDKPQESHTIATRGRGRPRGRRRGSGTDKRDSEGLQNTLEQTRLSEAAVAERRKIGRERMRKYRQRKREMKEALINSKMKEIGQDDISGGCRNHVDIAFTGATGAQCGINTDDSHRDDDNSKAKSQLVIDRIETSNMLMKSECSTVEDGSGYSGVKLEIIDNSSVGHAVDQNNQVEPGFDEALACEGGAPDTGTSALAGRPKRSPRRRKRPLTAAERQRNYRARLKAREEDKLQQGESHPVKDSARAHAFVLEDEASQIRKIEKIIHECKKGETHSTKAQTSESTQPKVCPISVQPNNTRATRSTTREEMEVEKGGSSPAGETVMEEKTASSQMKKIVKIIRECKKEESNNTKTHSNDSALPNICPDLIEYDTTRAIGSTTATCRQNNIMKYKNNSQQDTEDEIAFKRRKGRERMRKYRQKMKQKLMNSNDCDMPKIAAVWSLSEQNQTEEQMSKEGQFQRIDDSGQSGPVFNIGNMPSMNSILPGNVGSLYCIDPSLGYTASSINTLLYSDDSTELDAQTNLTDPYEGNQKKRAGRARSRLLNSGTMTNAKKQMQHHDRLYQKQGRLTSAERQRRYRERLQQDPEKWETYKRKAHNRYLLQKNSRTEMQVDKIRKQCAVRTRRWRAKRKDNKSADDIALDDSLDSLQDCVSEPVTVPAFPDLEASHNVSNILDTYPESGVAKSNTQCLKGREKTPEELEKLREANRERQRRHRAKKRGEFAQREQNTSILSEEIRPQELVEFGEKTDGSMNLDEFPGGQIYLQEPLDNEIHRTNQFGICPRKRGRPRLKSPIEEQPPLPQVKKKRGRPRKQKTLKIEQYTVPAPVDVPSGQDYPGEVLVSSAGNIPMVVKTTQVKGHTNLHWEEVPQVIPCEPPEAEFDWGNIDLDCFVPPLAEDSFLVKAETAGGTETISGEGEGPSVSGSARRKAFLPTKHDSPDPTLNAASVDEATHIKL